ncbi:hypothetical protein BH10CHL1_BH10CHL1_07050 [soil metagenome]
MQNTHLQRRSPSRSASSGSVSRFVEGPASWLITFLLIPGLLIAALLLPPVRLLDRLQVLTYTRIGSSGGAIADPDGALVTFPQEGMNGFFLASIKSTPRADFLAGQAGSKLYEAANRMQDYNLIPRSPFYRIDKQGTAPSQAILTIPIPNDSLPYETLGLYTWTGSAWELLPSTVLATTDGNDKLESRLNSLPANFMVVQTSRTVPAVTADLGTQGKLPQGAAVTFEAKPGLLLRGDGALEGNPPASTGTTTLAELRNWEGDVMPNGVPRTDLINNLLADPGLQENQLIAVEQVVAQNNYAGVVVDYRGVDAAPSARGDFVHLITQMAERLHKTGKVLSVRVEPAKQVSAEEWDTGGYDWQALGKVADKVILPTPDDPRAYQTSGEVDALLRWTATQIERRKIQVELPGQSIEHSGNYLIRKGYQEALKPLLGEVQAQTGDTGSNIELKIENPRIKDKVTWDDTLGVYRYTYMDDQKLERTVYIENANSLSRKLSLLQKYNVRDVLLRTPASNDIDPNIWSVLAQFQQGADLADTSGKIPNMSVAFTVLNKDNKVVMSNVRPLENAQLTFPAPAGEDDLRVEAQLVGDRGEALSIKQSTVLAGVSKVAAGSAESQPDAAKTSKLSASAKSNAPIMKATDILNAREGPGTNYHVLGELQKDSTYQIVGKNSTGDWWQIDTGGGQLSWVVGQLVSTAGDVNAVAVITDVPDPAASVAAAEAPVAAAAAPADNPVANPADNPAEAPAANPAENPAAAAPVVAAPAPSGGGSFGYGVQAHMVDNAQAGQVMGMVTGMGFNWVKQQVAWTRFENAGPGAIDWGGMDEIVNAANGAGVNVLFSIVKAPPWAREPGFDGSVEGPPADPATYANFVGAVAGHFCNTPLKAIEVWNEQNLHYEWGNKPLNAGDYVNLLAPAYAAIKNACPSMYVISGALTPAGNNPGLAVDDFTYLEDMFKAGVANYADGIGAHPSGYNVPADVKFEDACAAIQITGHSFNGPCDSPHHSWSFRSTMEGYWNIMNVYGAGNKKVWPTEFGWAAGGAVNNNYGYANDNDLNEQAQWTVKAYQMMRDWGFVGPAFLWNLNFKVNNPGTELAQWGIIGQGWEPLPTYTALKDMPK